MTAPAVCTHALSRAFGRRMAVDAVSMTVPQRSVYGFLGRNGAGKTTTLKMLLGLLRPTSGGAELFGVSVAQDRIRAARHVGALMEAHGFYTNLSGRENLDLTRTLLGAKRSEVERVLDVVEMRANGGRRVSDYSLGMRQRLGIARAMLGAPPLLILDEPTNGLDPDGIAEMRQFLRALPERTGATVLLSSHLLGEIEQTATHVGILNEGRLVVEGALAALKASLAPEVCIETDDLDRAGALAAAHGFAVTHGEGVLIAHLKPRDDARAATATLNRALVAADIAVFSIAPRVKSLEGIYRDAARKEAA
jgi:ABC-type multidrug transport system ATPase subunit